MGASVVDSDADVYILSTAPDANGFEFTAQVKHSTPGAEVTAIATDSFCADYETEYGSGVTCDIGDSCGEIVTFALYDNSDATPSPTTPGSNPATPSPVTVNGDGIQVINDGATQAYYLSFLLDGVDDCATNIQSVQLLSNGVYRDNDQYYYDGGHKYAFDYVATSFADLLPITLRIELSNGDYIDLDNIMTDLTGGSGFTSSKTCDGSDATNDTPAPIAGDTPAPSTPAPSTPAPIDVSASTTPDLGTVSGAVRYGGCAVVSVLFLFLAM